MNNIKIYTTKDCNRCHQAIEYFRSKKIDFEEKNITEKEAFKDELISMGIMTAPTIIISGKTLIGFDVEKVEAELKRDE